MMYKTIFANKDNVITLSLLDDAGNPFTFLSSGVSEVVFSIGELALSSLSSAITYDDLGVITLSLGHDTGVLALNRDFSYMCALSVIDPLHTNGQYLIHPKMKDSSLSIQVKD